MKYEKRSEILEPAAGSRRDVVRQCQVSTRILRFSQRPAAVGPTLRQLATRKMFKEAVQYAKGVLRDPQKYEAWRKHLKPTRSVYLAAIARYLKRTA